jgi:hypothetical protein
VHSPNLKSESTSSSTSHLALDPASPNLKQDPYTATTTTIGGKRKVLEADHLGSLDFMKRPKLEEAREEEDEDTVSERTDGDFALGRFDREKKNIKRQQHDFSSGFVPPSS